MTINPRIPPNTRSIEILIFTDAQVLDITGPFQVFSSANEHVPHGVTPYSVRIVAKTSPVATSCGLSLIACPLSHPDEPVDTLIVVGGRGVHGATEDEPLIGWLQDRARSARRIVAICTGAFLLGAAGLLNGRRAVTHWMNCQELASRFPASRVETDPIYVQDGPVWTSAGVTAGIDLSLALVAADLGHGVAIAIARDLVVFLKRPGGQAQFSTVLALQETGGDFERLHGWMADRLAGDLSVPALAAQAGMSERSFIRHYRASVGFTPARAVERMRVEAACQLLVSGKLSIKRISERCGFGSEETMRRSFLRQISSSPQDYRAHFAVTT